MSDGQAKSLHEMAVQIEKDLTAACQLGHELLGRHQLSTNFRHSLGDLENARNLAGEAIEDFRKAIVCIVCKGDGKVEGKPATRDFDGRCDNCGGEGTL